eukprot:9089108-Pyramimonas_sp.AAC.1
MKGTNLNFIWNILAGSNDCAIKIIFVLVSSSCTFPKTAASKAAKKLSNTVSSSAQMRGRVDQRQFAKLTSLTPFNRSANPDLPTCRNRR